MELIDDARAIKTVSEAVAQLGQHAIGFAGTLRCAEPHPDPDAQLLCETLTRLADLSGRLAETCARAQAVCERLLKRQADGLS